MSSCDFNYYLDYFLLANIFALIKPILKSDLWLSIWLLLLKQWLVLHHIIKILLDFHVLWLFRSYLCTFHACLYMYIIEFEVYDVHNFLTNIFYHTFWFYTSTLLSQIPPLLVHVLSTITSHNVLTIWEQTFVILITWFNLCVITRRILEWPWQCMHMTCVKFW